MLIGRSIGDLWWILMIRGCVVASVSHEIRDLREDLYRWRSGLPRRTCASALVWTLGFVGIALVTVLGWLLLDLDGLLVYAAITGAYFAVLEIGRRLLYRALTSRSVKHTVR